MDTKLFVFSILCLLLLSQICETRTSGGSTSRGGSRGHGNSRSHSSGGTKHSSSGSGGVFGWFKSKPAPAASSSSIQKQPNYPRQPVNKPIDTSGRHIGQHEHHGSQLKNTYGTISNSGNYGNQNKYSPHLLAPSSKASDAGWKITPAKTVSKTNAVNTDTGNTVSYSGYGKNPASSFGNTHNYGWKPQVTNPSTGQSNGNNIGWKPGVAVAAGTGAGVGATVGISQANKGISSQQTWGTHSGNPQHKTNTNPIQRDNQWNSNSGYAPNTNWNSNSNTGSSWNSHARYPTQAPYYNHGQYGAPHYTPQYGTGNTHITNNIITQTSYIPQTPNIHVHTGYGLNVGYAPHFVTYGSYYPTPYYCSWLYGCPRPYIPLFGSSYSSVHHYHHYNNNNNNGGSSSGGNYANNNESSGNAAGIPRNETIPYTTQPVIYNYEPINQDSDDSTEIKFENPYLIVGVENIVLYGEFQDSKHITIYIEQDSDGIEFQPSSIPLAKVPTEVPTEITTKIPYLSTISPLLKAEPI